MYKYVLFIFLTSCNIHAGLAVHPDSVDKPEFTGSNPLGVIRAEQKLTTKTTLFYEHISSIPDFEQGLGLNVLGIIYKVK